jgi:hypothetical protein
MKECKQCKTIKPLDQYYKSRNTVRSKCKDCENVKAKEYYYANRAAIKAKYIPKPRTKVKKTVEETRARQTAYKRLRRQRDLVFRLRSNIGTSIANALAAQGYKKTSKTCEILGCTFQEFKDYIEKQFLPNMNWENRSLWHLDHIVPVSFATTEQELIMLNHYSNLRPLWGVENQNKAARLTTEAVSHLLYKTIIENRICDQKFCAQNFFLTVDPISESNNGSI